MSRNSDSDVNAKTNMCNDNLFSYNDLDLTKNLFVYNNKSYPTKLHNKIIWEIKHMPERVGILHSHMNDNINSKNLNKKQPLLQILLDTGAMANTMCTLLVPHHAKRKSKNPIKWITACGDFTTTDVASLEFILPKFWEQVYISSDFHVCNHKIGYDMIMGQETLQKLGIIIDFKNGEIGWDNMQIEMKSPTFFDHKLISSIWQPQLNLKAVKILNLEL